MSMADFYDLFEARKAAEPTGPVTTVEIPGGATVHPYALKALQSEAAMVATAPSGTRNDTLNSAAFKMGRHVGAGTIDRQTVTNTLADAARQAGLDESEISMVLRDDPTSGLTQASIKAGPRVPPPLTEAPVLTVIAEPSDQIVSDFWNARPELEHLHHFARSRSVAPWAVLGNALARVIAATPPWVAIPPIVGGYASLNLFVGIVGRSGSGKGAAESTAKDAIDVGDIQVRNTGSGEGAVHAFVKRTKDGLEQHTTSILFSVPEIDSLGAVGARQGATLMPLLRSAWSGEQLGFQYADPAKNLLVPPHAYRMCLVAGIQPGRAGTLLDDEDGGTPQRFLWLPSTDPDAPNETPAEPEPIKWRMGGPMVVNAGSGLKPFKVCDQARDIIITERRKALRGEGEALDGHALLTRLKTAAALALLDKRHEVTDEDWDLSGVIAAKSDATRARVVASRQAEISKGNTARALAEAERQIVVGDTVAEKSTARVARAILRRLTDGELPRSEVRRRIAARDRDHFEEAVDHLQKAGQIEVQEVESGSVMRAIEVTS